MASRPPDDRFDPTPPTAEERGRFVMLNIVRLTGLAMVLLGILLTQGVIDLAGDQNAILGYTFIGVGLIEMFVLPQLLARQWRSPPE